MRPAHRGAGEPPALLAYTFRLMHDEPPPRHLPERTGRHFCIRCLAPVGADEYFRNDHVCDACAATEAYPLASTPEPREPKKKR